MFPRRASSSCRGWKIKALKQSRWSSFRWMSFYRAEKSIVNFALIHLCQKRSAPSLPTKKNSSTGCLSTRSRSLLPSPSYSRSWSQSSSKRLKPTTPSAKIKATPIGLQRLDNSKRLQASRHLRKRKGLEIS